MSAIAKFTQQFSADVERRGVARLAKTQAKEDRLAKTSQRKATLAQTKARTEQIGGQRTRAQAKEKRTVSEFDREAQRRPFEQFNTLSKDFESALQKASGDAFAVPRLARIFRTRAQAIRKEGTDGKGGNTIFIDNFLKDLDEIEKRTAGKFGGLFGLDVGFIRKFDPDTADELESIFKVDPKEAQKRATRIKNNNIDFSAKEAQKARIASQTPQAQLDFVELKGKKLKNVQSLGKILKGEIDKLKNLPKTLKGLLAQIASFDQVNFNEKLPSVIQDIRSERIKLKRLFDSNEVLSSEDKARALDLKSLSDLIKSHQKSVREVFGVKEATEGDLFSDLEDKPAPK